MKYTINNISTGEDEVIVNYLRMTPEIERIVNFIKGEQTKLIGWKDKEQKLIDIKTILYIETVDGNTFAYTEEEVLKLDYTLAQLEQLLNDINFFRCSKSMIINIDKVDSLRSLPSNRIDARMVNGEHIIISRTYASDFRRILRKGAQNE
ncbi:MAG: LytTR family transcriptional regulator DNA-binding domain-containing protein [Lachnospiraceae bacterium]|nr:LytTR family transcriptional regulator DNA-binding domain-containing protein [Lachnospiraceae bacterium]